MISNGVLVKDKSKVKDIIEKNSYYFIVDSYGRYFKDQSNKYVSDVSFDEIYALYEFDEKIRSLFMKYILKIERMIKTRMELLVIEKYDMYDYLKDLYFDQKFSKQEINDFIKSINNKVDTNYYYHKKIEYHKQHNGNMPIWLMMRIITFGAMSKYYKYLNQKDRQTISKYFNISDKQLKQILINLNNVRNICAHGDELFNYRNKCGIKLTNIDSFYIKKDNLTNLYIIIKCMKLFLDEHDYREFIEIFYKELEILEKQLHTITITEILKIIGFNIEPRSSNHTGLLK